MGRHKRWKLEVGGFDEIIRRLNDLEGDLRGTTERALRVTHAQITIGAKNAIRPHRKTGGTERSLVTRANITWEGDSAYVPVGFRIRQGGLASIFLIFGTPTQKPSKPMREAFFGQHTIAAVRRRQAEIFWDEIRRLER